MKMKPWLLVVLLLLPISASAQGTRVDTWTPALSSERGQRVAEIASWGTVGTALALDVKASWDAPDRAHQLQLTAARAFINISWATIVKGLTNRERPDGSDRQSFYSQHTALAFSTLGGPRTSISLSLAVGTGAGRVAANKHWLTDVLAGAAVGAITSRIR